MIDTPEIWVPSPGTPSTLQKRFSDLAVLSAGGTQIVSAGYNPTELVCSTPSPGTNTGNGTMSKPFILGSAVAETWTVTATSASNFTVSGGTSGSKAAATVNQNYNNGFVSFTVLAGVTPFVSGDKFTFIISDENPESSITGAGYTQNYKESTTDLVEVIYTK